MSNPYPDYAARQYPIGKKPDRRRIVKCSEPGAWYKDMIGQTITIHYFSTFGAWDTQGRWLWYYDLSGPENENNLVEATKRVNNWFKKIFK